MITGAQLVPFRDRLSALIDAAQGEAPPLVIPPTPIPPTNSGPDDAIYPLQQGASLADAKGHVWSFGNKGGTDGGDQIWGYNVLKDGVDVPYGAKPDRPVSCFLLRLHNGVIWQNSIIPGWWSYDTGSSWVGAAPPFTPPPVSPDGTTLVPGQDWSHFLIDAGGHRWTFGPPSNLDPNGPRWVLKDAYQFASGNASKITISHGVIWVYAGAQWYRASDTNWVLANGPPVAPPVVVVPPTPVPPPPVIPGNEPPLSPMEIATGLTRTTFFDDWDDLSTIDREAAKQKSSFQPPFKWASPVGDGKTGITTQNSILRIAHDANGSGGNCLTTMNWYYDEVHHKYDIRGWGFKGSASISCALACDPHAADPNSKTWPAFWSLAKEQKSVGIEQYQGNSCALLDGSNARHMEFDFIELGFPFPLLGPGESILFALNFWEVDAANSQPYPNCGWVGAVMNNPSAETRPAGFDYREMNVYTTVYLHPSDNNGYGSIKRYITRPGGAPFHVANCDQSWKASNEPGTWRDTNTLMPLIDKQTYPLSIGGGAGFPAEFDWVCVRQAA